MARTTRDLSPLGRTEPSKGDRGYESDTSAVDGVASVLCEHMFVIRLKGLPLSDEEASELARRLRSHRDPVGVGVAERLERGVLLGTAMIGTSRPEAEVLLNVIEDWTPDRLRDIARSLRELVAE